MPESHVFLIFGGNGDLAYRKLLPALFSLLVRQKLLTQSYVVATARSEMSDEEYRSRVREALSAHDFSEEELSQWCDERIFYQALGRENPDYDALADRVEELEEDRGLSGNRVLYLSLPPAAFEPTIKGIGASRLAEGDGWTRLVVEKPFGHDLDSARELNDLVHQHFSEEQIYRIDHFLGKETVQNLLAFRFANALFETVWNRDRIERVEITVAESLGVEDRAGYFDKVGTLRDMVQNHLTQLLTLVAMEAPSSFSARSIRREKVKVLDAVEDIKPEDIVLGQYADGRLNGRAVPAYADEPGVQDDSRTETFAAVRVNVSNWRWQGVPFFLRTGKRMESKRTQIAIHFRRAPVSLFRQGEGGVHRNVLLITLQPNEGFDLHFEVKAPGDPFNLETQQLRFRYEDAFGPVPEAYETLLLEILRGDQTLFVHSEEVEAAWQLYEPLLDSGLPVHDYPAGSWGPDEAERLTRWVDA